MTIPEMGLLARVGLEKRVKLYSTKQTKIWSGFVGNVFSDNQSYTEIAQLNDFPMAGEVTEGSSVGFSTWRVRFTKQYRPLMRAIGFKWTESANITDIYREVAAPAAKLALSMNKTKEQVGANVLNLGFSTVAANLGPDGLSLFNRAHLLESGTGSNRPTVDIAFNQAGVKQAIQELASQKSDKGDPFPCMGPYALWGPTSLMVDMQTFAASGKVIGSAYNDPNVPKNFVDKVIINPYLTSTTAWGLVTLEETENPLFMLNRIPLRTRNGYDETRLTFRFVTFEEYIASFWGWRGTWGTTG